MLLIYVPTGRDWAKDYALQHVFSLRLGLEFQSHRHEKNVYEIHDTESGKSLTLPDVFFKQETDNWLTLRDSFLFDVRSFSVGGNLYNKQIKFSGVSAFYYDESKSEIEINPEAPTNHIPIDIFGSLFFMFSSYEEVCKTKRDQHNRFSSKYSELLSHGFYDKPFIDIYIELLWACLELVFPHLQRKQLSPSINVTCDIDHPYTKRSITARARRTASRLLGRQSRRITRKLQHIIDNDVSIDKGDIDHAGLKYIMSVNESAGRQVVFYFIPQRTNARYDPPHAVHDRKVTGILQEIVQRGHVLGIHPGYDTHQDKVLMSKAAEIGGTFIENMTGQKSPLCARQHYLRWDPLQTPSLLEHAEVSEDSSLSFSELAGFRNGTCHEFHLIDLKGARETQVLERPLIVMESSIMSPNAMGLGKPEEALEQIKFFMEQCKNVGGCFTLLWHNSNFTLDWHHEIYEDIIKMEI